MANFVQRIFTVCPACQAEAKYALDPKKYQGTGNFNTKPSCESCGIESTHSFNHVNGVITGCEVKQGEVAQKKCLTLLRYHKEGSDLYIVISDKVYKFNQFDLDKEFHFNENTCPTNYLGVLMVVDGDDPDPHGVFEFVRSVLVEDVVKELNVMESALYGCNNEQLLCQIFPEVIPKGEDEVVH